jgi:hypothetical protein
MDHAAAIAFVWSRPSIGEGDTSCYDVLALAAKLGVCLHFIAAGLVDLLQTRGRSPSCALKAECQASTA